MENQFTTPQESLAIESVSEQTLQGTTPEPFYTFPPIASFWRRLFAWMVDVIILGITGLLIGSIFGSFFMKIGPYGRLVGLILVIYYFGVNNSKFGGGQTLGKKLLKIAVVDKDSQFIGLGRSIARILIIYLPVLFNGWQIQISQNIVFSWLLATIIFGLGAAILYTMVFNSKTRQGIHDLLLGTYVVHLTGKPVDSYPTASRIHWKVSGILVGVVAVGTLIASLVAPSLISKTPLTELSSLYDILQADQRFFSVGVQDKTIYASNAGTSHVLIITVWNKGDLEEEESKAIAYDIAKTVLENATNLDRYNGMQITVTTAYDLGIASGNRSMWYAYTTADWRKLIFPAVPLGSSVWP
jgi:uncharacterized RDD family membrane protein YckC